MKTDSNTQVEFKNDPRDNYETAEIFNSENLIECLQHYHDTKEIEPLENAIDLHRSKIENITEQLTLLITVARDINSPYFANKLQQIKNEIKL